MRLVFKGVLLASRATALLAVPAQAASNSQLQGRGSTSQFFCGTSQPTVPASIDFNATKNKGTLFGSFFIGDAALKFGSLSGGTVNNNQYSLTGSVTAYYCGVTTYPNGALGQATISGTCG